MPSLIVSFLRAGLLLLALGLGNAAWADPPGRVGRVAELQGTVWIYDTDQGEWVAAERNRPLTSGDHLSTDRDARAELRIGSTTVRVAPGSDLVFTRLDDQRMQLQLQSGRITARLRNNESAAEFEVDTPDGRFLPARAGHYLIDRDDRGSSAMAWSGELRFEAADSALTVPQGQHGEFWKEGGATHYTWAGPPQDSFTDWALAENQRDEAAAAVRYVSPEMTGWEDLDRHGRWETTVDYGTVWVPYQVAPGWAPYRYGHWAWVRPWGWTWVDDAPWGFAPFHYGRWAWFGGRWCWVPGTYVARPVYAPALVGWVGSPGVNVSVHIGSGPVVGWVPLAPREIYVPPYQAGRDHWRHLNPHAPDRFYRPQPPQHGPVMYSNRGVPNGITVVPADTLKQRQPVASVAGRVSPEVINRIVQQKTAVVQAPPPPTPAHAAPVAPHPVVPVAPPTRPVERAPDGRADDGRRGHGVTTQPVAPVVPASPRAETPQPPAPPRAVVAPPPAPRGEVVVPPSPARREPAAPAVVPPAPRAVVPPPPRQDGGEVRHHAPAAPQAQPVQPVPPAPHAQPVPPAQPAQHPQPPQRPQAVPPPTPAAQPQPAPQRAVEPAAPAREQGEPDGRRQRPRDPGEGRPQARESAR